MSARNLSLVTPDAGFTDAAIEIAARRANTERVIRDLLIAGKDAEALVLMRRHLGIDASGYRTSQSKHTRTGRRRSGKLALAANDKP